jgi:hypothetical protein
MPPRNFKIAIVKPKTKQISGCLVNAYQGGQKNRNGKTTTVFFFTMFSTSGGTQRAEVSSI